ncbi:hypothetical protein JMI89_02000 [Frischella sp. Ac48]|uniref:Uncharacterized protein n=1 Tax=Frischella japonica TaxID=2741544 RepID=A0ABR7QZE5_9GAMM|nr:MULTISPECIES: hypothetical protein [Frischella]MBC9131343.1 hypothetical protein [Frischella japonica]MBX4132403.1 hypothetical protein [Frischella sp. Ac48]
MFNSEDTQLTENTSQTALVTFSSLLIISRQLDIMSLMFTMIGLSFALIASLSASSAMLIVGYVACFLIGLFSKYYALRIAFDKKLFDYLATKFDQLPNTLKELDDTLIQLKLIKSKIQPSRSITDRQMGTLILLKKQIITLVIQTILLSCISIIGIIPLS